MTREEAIVYFESLLKRFEEMHETETSYWGKVHTETTIEASSDFNKTAIIKNCFDS